MIVRRNDGNERLWTLEWRVINTGENEIIHTLNRSSNSILDIVMLWGAIPAVRSIGLETSI